MPGYPQCLVIHDAHDTGVSTMRDIRDIYDVDIGRDIKDDTGNEMIPKYRP
jgi:hypothetical protein